MNTTALPGQEMTVADLVGEDGVFTDGDWVESKDQDPNGSVRLLQLADVGVGRFIDKSARFLTMKKARQLRCTFLEADDLMIARMPDPIGRACIFPGSSQPCVTVVDVCILRPDPAVVDRRWLLRTLNAPQFRFQVEQFTTGTTRKRISRGNLSKLGIKVPPLPEQRRIAAILDKADAIRRKRREAVALTEELLRSAFLEMFGDPVTNPKGWPIVKLGNLAEIQGGLQVTRKRATNPIEVPYLRVANVYRDAFDLEEIKTIRVTSSELERTKLQEGDVLFVEGHGNAGEIGRSAVWSGQIDRCTHQNHLIRARFGKEAAPSFVSRQLNSHGGRRRVLRLAKTTSGLNTISTRQLKAVPLMVPPMAAQAEFVRFEQATLSTNERLVHAAEVADNLFHSLVQRAFRGDL